MISYTQVAYLKYTPAVYKRLGDSEAFVSECTNDLLQDCSRNISITILVSSTFAISIGLRLRHPFRHPHVVHIMELEREKAPPNDLSPDILRTYKYR